MYSVLIITTIIGLFSAISAIIKDRKRRKSVKQSIIEFEKDHPPKL